MVLPEPQAVQVLEMAHRLPLVGNLEAEPWLVGVQFLLESGNPTVLVRLRRAPATWFGRAHLSAFRRSGLEAKLAVVSARRFSTLELSSESRALL